MMTKEQSQCFRCVMDRSAKEIEFDENGICNFCIQSQKSLKENESEKKNLVRLVEKIRNTKGKYNCLIGLSGGVDSSMVLHHAVAFGLKPLAFSLDNGWNLQGKSDQNIMNLVEGLKVPFYRYVIDFKKFSELQAAFIKGGVMNLEAITDHVLMATTYEMATKYNIKYILSGGNTETESIMPASWGEDPRDLTWIQSIYKAKTGHALKGLPLLPLWKEQYYRLIRQIKIIRLLDYVLYNREDAIKLLKKKYNFVPYGEKHCESIFTWWYQNFYLFTKWGIDKRKAHLSSLINSGQMNRSEALEMLKENPVYPKLGIENKAMRYTKKSHDDYKNSAWLRRIIIKLYRYIPRSWKS